MLVFITPIRTKLQQQKADTTVEIIFLKVFKTLLTCSAGMTHRKKLDLEHNEMATKRGSERAVWRMLKSRATNHTNAIYIYGKTEMYRGGFCVLVWKVIFVICSVRHENKYKTLFQFWIAFSSGTKLF